VLFNSILSWPQCRLELPQVYLSWRRRGVRLGFAVLMVCTPSTTQRSRAILRSTSYEGRPTHDEETGRSGQDESGYHTWPHME